MLWRVDVSESHVRIMLCRWESRRYGFGTLQDSRVEMEARQSLMINDRIYCGLLMHENGYRRRNWCCCRRFESRELETLSASCRYVRFQGYTRCNDERTCKTKQFQICTFNSVFRADEMLTSVAIYAWCRSVCCEVVPLPRVKPPAWYKAMDWLFSTRVSIGVFST